MSEQLSFDAFVGKPTDRLFFAVFLPDHAASSVGKLQGDLQQKYRLSGRPLPADRLHITLVHLGDYAGLPRDIVEKGMTAGAGLRIEPFDVTFDRVGSFAGRARNKPLVMQGAEGAQSVLALQGALHDQMRQAGLGKLAKAYTPHVTLLYDNADVPEQPIEPISWRVTEVVLVHSLLGKTQHYHLGRWTLGA